MITEGTIPINPVAAGEKDRIKSKMDVGIRVYLEAQRVDKITPGLREKLTGPITPKNPARILAIPVKVIPRFILWGI